MPRSEFLTLPDWTKGFWALGPRAYGYQAAGTGWAGQSDYLCHERSEYLGISASTFELCFPHGTQIRAGRRFLMYILPTAHMQSCTFAHAINRAHNFASTCVEAGRFVVTKTISMSLRLNRADRILHCCTKWLKATELASPHKYARSLRMPQVYVAVPTNKVKHTLFQIRQG